MAHVLQSGDTWVAAMTVSAGRLLCEQIDDTLAVGTCPNPCTTWVRVGLVAPVPKIFGHRGVILPEAEGEAAIEVIVGRNTVRDGLGFGQHDVAADFFYHKWKV